MRKMIKFETVKDCPYKDIKLPQRSTQGAAGYDFYAPYDFTIKKKESLIVKSYIKAKMPKNMFLRIFSRSSWNVKHKIFVTCSGIIDSDYYGNEENDGNILIQYTNKSDKGFSVKAGDRIAQGIFLRYYTTDDDTANMDTNNKKRLGGIGSTGK